MSFRSYDLLKLVQDFGEEITLRKVTTSGNYNPATGQVDGSATTDYVTTGYFYNYDTGISGNFDSIVRGVRKCVIPALGFTVEPDTEDTIVGNGDNVEIISVVTVFSNGTPVCYLCDVRE
jgi:hypothetical protein